MSSVTSQRGQDLIKQLASFTLKATPESSSKAWIRAEVQPGMIDLGGRYVNAEGEKTQYFDVPHSELKLIRELHQIMARDDGRSWKVALINVDRIAGKFSVDFEYDDWSRWNDNPYADYSGLK